MFFITWRKQELLRAFWSFCVNRIQCAVQKVYVSDEFTLKVSDAPLPSQPVQKVLIKTALNIKQCFHWNDIRLIWETQCSKKKKAKAFHFVWLDAKMRSCCSTLQWQQNRFQTWASLLENERSCLCRLSSTRREGWWTVGGATWSAFKSASAFSRRPMTPSGKIESIAIPSLAAMSWSAARGTCSVRLRMMLKDLRRVLLARHMVDIKGKEQLGGIVLSRFGKCPAT